MTPFPQPAAHTHASLEERKRLFDPTYKVTSADFLTVLLPLRHCRGEVPLRLGFWSQLLAVIMLALNGKQKLEILSKNVYFCLVDKFCKMC